MPLQREMVARAALDVLDEVGLDGLTMRRLAAYLDIQNPSLYWHFTNKQELLNCMAELMFADIFAELQYPEQSQDWADWLAAFARLFRKAMLAHRDGARVLAEADSSPTKFFESVVLALDVLQRAGFEGRQAVTGVTAVLNYVLGNVFEAQADPFSLPDGEDEKHLHDLSLPIDEEHFQSIAALLLDTDIRSPAAASSAFEAGLSLILDGLRANLTQEHSNNAGRENP
jgi:TetR/AcrR family tetracycline transcriptional repressor